MYIYIYIYIHTNTYIHVCVCVCVLFHYVCFVDLILHVCLFQKSNDINSDDGMKINRMLLEKEIHKEQPHQRKKRTRKTQKQEIGSPNGFWRVCKFAENIQSMLKLKWLFKYLFFSVKEGQSNATVSLAAKGLRAAKKCRKMTNLKMCSQGASNQSYGLWSIAGWCPCTEYDLCRASMANMASSEQAAIKLWHSPA